MKWQGHEESGNVEDRRRIGKKGVAIGGGIGLLLLLIGSFLGVDPQQLKQFPSNIQVEGGGETISSRERLTWHVRRNWRRAHKASTAVGRGLDGQRCHREEV